MPAVSALPASTRPSGAGSTESSRPSAGLAILLALLGLGAMATALLGPLALGWIDYHVSSGAADRLRGGDVAGLVLVGPVALAAAWRVATGRPGADALALAPASYGLYMYTERGLRSRSWARSGAPSTRRSSGCGRTHGRSSSPSWSTTWRSAP
jgi:hypothetical protein